MDPRYTLAGVAVMLAVFAVSGVPWWLVLVVVAVVGAGVFFGVDDAGHGGKRRRGREAGNEWGKEECR